MNRTRLLATLLCGISVHAGASVYRCAGTQGEPVFTDRACPDGGPVAMESLAPVSWNRMHGERLRSPAVRAVLDRADARLRRQRTAAGARRAELDRVRSVRRAACRNARKRQRELVRATRSLRRAASNEVFRHCH